MRSSCSADTDPLGQRRARQRQTGSLEDPFLSIQRLMIGIFRHQHLREQPGGGQALIDHLCRHRRLDQRLALRTRPLAAYMPLDLEQPRRVIELFAHVLADALHRAAATAHRSFRLMSYFHPWQMGGQRRTPRLLFR